MATIKSSTRIRNSGKKKHPLRPKWQRVARWFIAITFSLFMLMAIVQLLLRYYHHVSNHK